jgi:hypothetical protein
MANSAMINGAMGPSADVTADAAACVNVVTPSAYQR